MEAKYYDFYNTEILEIERHQAQAEKDSLIELARAARKQPAKADHTTWQKIGVKLGRLGLLRAAQNL